MWRRRSATREWSAPIPTDGRKKQKGEADDLNRFPVSAVLLDAKGRIKSFNNQFQNLCAGKAVEGADIFSLVAREDRAKLRASLKEGSLEASTQNMRLHHGPIVQLLADKRKKGKDQILCFTDLSQHARLETLSAQAQKMQAVGHLAGGIAHDFNNLLTAIIGACDMAEKSDEIGEIRQSAMRGADLVRQLLAFSRQQTLTPETLNIADTINNMAGLLKRLLGEDIVITMQHARNLSPVLADKTQFEQVVLNLAVNARDAMQKAAHPKSQRRERGALTIRTSNLSAAQVRKMNYALMPPARYVLCEIADTGPGIPESDMGSIFEPFFSTKETGTGLGLSTVYGIVKQTGGFIFPENHQEGGCVMRIFLPIHSETPRHSLKAHKNSKPSSIKKSAAKAQILLVEDDASVRNFAARALQTQGHKVLEAKDGKEALKKHTASIDLLVTDIVMPKMSGTELFERLKKKHPQIHAIFISGYAERAFRRHPTLEDALFLPKPFGLAELSNAVQKVIKKKR